MAEPTANAIGVFGEGRNVVWQPSGSRTLQPHWEQTFSQSPFFEAIQRRLWTPFTRPLHWVLIADLGGYTLDFAMVGFDLGTLDLPGGVHRGKRRLATHSAPLGVAALDRRIAGVLDGQAQGAFADAVGSINQQRLEALHRTVYQRDMAYRTAHAVLNEDPTERARIRACVDTFAADVANVVQHFIEVEQYQRVDDLILTGGGMNIPAVRDAVRDRLADIGRFKHAYVPAEQQEALDDNRYTRLTRKLVRGATALGGSSLYFDVKAA